MLVPALNVGPEVRDLRLQLDASAAAGVPPHVTLMFPFLPPPDLTGPIVDSLEALVRGARAFELRLTGVNEFELGVVYLEPEPAEPFVKLTTEISRRFGMLPYGGDFGEEPVPHLTVGLVEQESARRELVNQVSRLVPIVVKAESVWLMIGSNAGSWNLIREMRFGD